MAAHERDVAAAFLVLFAQGNDTHLQEVQAAILREDLGEHDQYSVYKCSQPPTWC